MFRKKAVTAILLVPIFLTQLVIAPQLALASVTFVLTNGDSLNIEPPYASDTSSDLTHYYFDWRWPGVPMTHITTTDGKGYIWIALEYVNKGYMPLTREFLCGVGSYDFTAKFLSMDLSKVPLINLGDDSWNSYDISNVNHGVGYIFSDSEFNSLGISPSVEGVFCRNPNEPNLIGSGVIGPILGIGTYAGQKVYVLNPPGGYNAGSVSYITSDGDLHQQGWTQNKGGGLFGGFDVFGLILEVALNIIAPGIGELISEGLNAAFGEFFENLLGQALDLSGGLSGLFGNPFTGLGGDLGSVFLNTVAGNTMYTLGADALMCLITGDGLAFRNCDGENVGGNGPTLISEGGDPVNGTVNKGTDPVNDKCPSDKKMCGRFCIPSSSDCCYGRSMNVPIPSDSPGISCDSDSGTCSLTDKNGNSVSITQRSDGSYYYTLNFDTPQPVNFCIVTNSYCTADGSGCTFTRPTHPSCNSFSASPSSISVDESSQLSWTCSNTTSCSIDNGVGQVTPPTGGSVSVTPSQTTMYTLSCSGAGENAARMQTTVTVTKPSPSCTPSPSNFCKVIGNDPTDIINRDSCGVDSIVKHCPYGCTGGECKPTPAITVNTHLRILPSLLRSGDTTKLYWGVSNADSCTVTGSNGDGTASSATGAWNTLSSDKDGVAYRTSSQITGQTTYTLNCLSLQREDGTRADGLHETQTVNIIPVFCEPGVPGC